MIFGQKNDRFLTCECKIRLMKQTRPTVLYLAKLVRTYVRTYVELRAKTVEKGFEQ